MAWPHCERLMACPHGYLFLPHTPNQFFFIRQPTSVLTVLTAAPQYLFVLVGGVGVIYITPPRTSTSNVCLVLSTTNVTASSANTSCAASVVLSLQVLTGAVPSVPYPVSSVGSLIAAPVKLSFI